MENATKALLIAAATLTTVLIVTFGIRIFNSTSSTGNQAKETGTKISNQTFQATEYAIAGITGATMNSGQTTTNNTFNFTIGFPDNRWNYEYHTFTAVEGMTWGEWCESAYNINNDFYIDRKSCIVSRAYGLGVYKGNYDCVPRSDNTIKKGVSYKLSVDWTVGVEREPEG